ncbi:MAG: N-acetyltransferase family protein [Steroidobacteraceae bacterium]
MNTITVRQATLADVEAVAVLFDAYRQFYGRDPDPALATGYIRARLGNRESVILVALDNAGRVAGFCQLYPTFCSVEAAPIFTLYDLFVAPGSRRGGAARALLSAAETLAADSGKVRMDLMTAKTNASAQALYESLGWVRDEAFHTYNRRIRRAEAS